MFQSTKVRPYVYLCFHKETGKFYIGYREKNVKLNLTSDIDFPKYKTSSKEVRPNFDEYNWIILAEFETGIDAYQFEQQLIFENWGNPLLINKHCYYGKDRFRPVSLDNNTKKVPWNKGKSYTLDTTPWNKGKTGLQQHSKETKQIIKDRRASQVFTQETFDKRAASMLGKNKGRKLGSRPKVVCRLSDKKLMPMANFVQWCKKNENT